MGIRTRGSTLRPAPFAMPPTRPRGSKRRPWWTVGTNNSLPAERCYGRPPFGRRCSPIRLGSTCSAPAAARAAPSALWTCSPRSAPWCSAYGAHGVRARQQFNLPKCQIHRVTRGVTLNNGSPPLNRGGDATAMDRGRTPRPAGCVSRLSLALPTGSPRRRPSMGASKPGPSSPTRLQPDVIQHGWRRRNENVGAGGPDLRATIAEAGPPDNLRVSLAVLSRRVPDARNVLRWRGTRRAD
jgi:hypothetical protein